MNLNPFDLELFISHMPWSAQATEREKTLVIGNLRNLHRILCALGYLDNPFIPAVSEDLPFITCPCGRVYSLNQNACCPDCYAWPPELLQFPNGFPKVVDQSEVADLRTQLTAQVAAKELLRVEVQRLVAALTTNPIPESQCKGERIPTTAFPPAKTSILMEDRDYIQTLRDEGKIR